MVKYFIKLGMFGFDKEIFDPINNIRNCNDWYLVCEDFESYCKA